MKKFKNLSNSSKLFIRMVYSILLAWLGGLVFNHIQAWIGVIILVLAILLAIRGVLISLNQTINKQ